MSAGTVALIGKWTPRGNWLTATVYAVNDLVTQSNNLYVCIVAHTSGTFASDFAAGKRRLIDGDTARAGADNVFTGVNDFTGGTVAVPTKTLADNTTAAASTAFVQAQLASVGTQPISNNSVKAASTAYVDRQVGQFVSVETGAVATGATLIPCDNSIPQITEGDEYITLSITPKSATSKLVVEAVIIAANSVAPNAMTVALFQDATANALAASSFTTVAATAAETVNLRHTMASGTTLATTFRVRIGGNSAGTTTLNGAGGTRIYGGVAASSLTIREVL